MDLDESGVPTPERVAIEVGHQGVALYPLRNGWAVSITSKGAGRLHGLLELAVWRGSRIHYRNPVADGGVRGYLTPQEAVDLAHLVAGFDPDA